MFWHDINWPTGGISSFRPTPAGIKIEKVDGKEYIYIQSARDCEFALLKPFLFFVTLPNFLSWSEIVRQLFHNARPRQLPDCLSSGPGQSCLYLRDTHTYWMSWLKGMILELLTSHSIDLIFNTITIVRRFNLVGRKIWAKVHHVQQGFRKWDDWLKTEVVMNQSKALCFYLLLSFSFYLLPVRQSDFGCQKQRRWNSFLQRISKLRLSSPLHVSTKISRGDLFGFKVVSQLLKWCSTNFTTFYKKSTRKLGKLRGGREDSSVPVPIF